MPYIKSDNDRREKLRNGEPALNAGELNYQIFYYVKHNPPIFLPDENTSKQIKIYVDNFLGKNPNYQRYNDMTGCLIRCYKEINRRFKINIKPLFIKIMNSYDDEIASYENKKISENGDVK